MTALRWGILSTGTIARTLATAITLSDKAELAAIGSRNSNTAAAFAAEFGIPRDHAHANYERLIADPTVDIIYVATPHSSHAEWTLAALEAGRHVLCEKPLGLNHAQAMAMVETAQRCGVFLMEAFMYRLHPQTREILVQVEKGAIGKLKHIEASFGYRAPFDPHSRLFANDLAGGGIMDVGCYPMSFVRLLTGGEPNRLNAFGAIGSSDVDEHTHALLEFDGHITANVGTSVSLPLRNDATLYGTEGRLHVPNPWLPSRDGGEWSFALIRGGETRKIEGEAPPLYTIEVDHVCDTIADGALQSPLMSWQDSLGNALALDNWRRDIGLQFVHERAEAHPGPLRGHLRPSDKQIPGASVKYLDKPVSRLVMGCDNQPNISHASIMWDDFFEAGGNCFDTAFIYGQGAMEAYLGHWHTQRNVREDMVIVGKGAHTPHNFPEFISKQLDVTLERLQTDYVDVYFLHRDNLDVPVDEFADALNAEVGRGRVKAFGGSNWGLPRVAALNQYAANNGLQGFSAISNNFSLAQMVEPIWPGIEVATQGEFVDYLTATQTALMPWSAQARGFFTAWADEVIAATARENTVITTMQPTMEELRRVWFCDQNLARRERARTLAKEHGVEMINIALAYVLNQPFPTFALIGPRVLSETASCIRSLTVALSPDDIAYLRDG